LVEAAGAQCLTLRSDATQEADVISAFDQTEASLGPISCVVVNAGIIGPTEELADMTAERMRRVIDTNLFGALLTAREAARRLKSGTGNRSIVIISSIAARLGSAFEFIDYAATKGGTDSLTIGLAKELARDGIRVNAVRPGLIETEIHASGGVPDRAERLGKGTPIGRSGTAMEVAEAIVWLASPAASYATGTFIDISGGR